jgi:protein involved in temperature-dependent protein secretion
LAITLPKGSAINNTATLEAGYKCGSIKKSRHTTWVEVIDQALKKVGQKCYFTNTAG